MTASSAASASEPVPATGFSIGVSRLLSALQMVKSPIVSGAGTPGPVVVLVMDKDRDRRLPAHGRDPAPGRHPRRDLSRLLRHEGADEIRRPARQPLRRSSRARDERARGEVQIKDLIEGAKAAEAIASNEEWKAARPAQFSVPEDKLVEAVREVLARHFG